MSKTGEIVPHAAPPHTLAIDIGGTGLKASVLTPEGKMMVKRVRSDTPPRVKPEQLVDALAKLVKRLPSFDRISIGFPGVVHQGKDRHRAAFRYQILARLSAGEDAGRTSRQAGASRERRRSAGPWHHRRQGVGGRADTRHRSRQRDLRQRQHDAGISNWRIIRSISRSPTTTISAMPARKKLGDKKWSRRVFKAIDLVHTLTNYDTLYLGGGNSANLVGTLPLNVKTESNDMGIIGGVRLWDDAIWEARARWRVWRGVGRRLASPGSRHSSGAYVMIKERHWSGAIQRRDFIPRKRDDGKMVECLAQGNIRAY